MFQCSHPLEQEEAEGNDDDVGADGDDDDATESKMDQGGEDKGRGGTSQQVPSQFYIFEPLFQSNLTFNRRVAKFNATKTLLLPIASCRANFARTSETVRSNRLRS